MIQPLSRQLGGQIDQRYNDGYWRLNPRSELWKSDACLPWAGYGSDTARDVTGRNHDGVVDDPSMWQRMPYLRRNGWAFDGSQRILLDAPKPTDAITLSAWVWSDPGNTGYARIIASDSGSAYGAVLQRRLGVWRFTVWDGALRLAEASVTHGQWVHLLGTFGGGVMRLYVDGELADTSSASSIVYTTLPFSVGAPPTASPHPLEYWIGRIADPAILSNEVSDAEARVFASRDPSLRSLIVGHQLFAPVVATGDEDDELIPPYRVVAQQAYLCGAAAGVAYSQGAIAGESFMAGQEAGCGNG